MKLQRLEIVNNKHIEEEEKFIPSNEELASIDSLISFDEAYASMEANRVDNLVIVSLRIKGKMILKSTRSFVPVEYKFDEEDTQTFSLTNDPDIISDEITWFPKDEIDFHNDLFSLIVTSIPLKIVSDDEPENFSKDNWEVMSEDEYYKRQAAKTDSRFDILDSFEFDDEEESK